MLGLRPVTSRHELSERLNAFLGDGGKALFAFSAGLERNYNHRSQLLAAVPSLRRHPGLSLAFFGEADHTFSANEVQDALIERIVGWVETVAGASVGDREAIPTAG